MPENPLIVIAARKGSKRLPGKNMKMFNGKPLALWTLEQAKRLGYDTIVSTDIPELIQMAGLLGIPAFMRSENLCGDDVNKLDVIRDAVDIAETDGKYDPIIDLDVTAPWRQDSDIMFAIKRFRIMGKPVKISVVPSRQRAGFNQVVFRNNRWCVLDKSVFNMNAAVLIVSRAVLPKLMHPLDADAAVQTMQQWQSHDIDDSDDFDIAELMMRKHWKQDA